MDHVAVRVGEHLDLDVTRVLQVALQVHGGSEKNFSPSREAPSKASASSSSVGDPEALAASPTGGLEATG